MRALAKFDNNVVPLRRNPMTEADAERQMWSHKLALIGADQDRRLFAELFNHFAPRIKAYGLSTQGIPGTGAFAEELVQETMIRVWRRAATFDAAKASATTWIFTIARNARIDLLRRSSKHNSDIDADDVWLEAEPEQQPVLQLEAHRNITAIREAIGQLPVEQSQVLAKVYLEGKPHSEVALELNLPLGTVKSRVRLALSKMKLLVSQ
jgi:RNA polymerase sigma-70 factor (ECF subfamily)